MPAIEPKLVIPQLHSIEIPAAKGLVVALSAYKPEVAYEQLRLGFSQKQLFEYLRRYNEEGALEGVARIRPVSPLEECRLSKNGNKHEAFENTFERNGKPYVVAVTNMLLRRPGPKKYKEKRSGQTVWRRDVYAFNGTDFAKIAEGQPIPRDGVITMWDEALGLPIETTGSHDHKHGTQTHFYFAPDVEEVALLRYRGWHDHEYCFSLYARYEPTLSFPAFGLRAVRGDVPSYEKIAGKLPESINPENVNEDYRRGYEDGEKAGLEAGCEKARQEFLQKLDKFRKQFE